MLDLSPGRRRPGRRSGSHAGGRAAPTARAAYQCPRGVAQADDPAEAARDIRDQINQYRTGATRPTPQKAIAQSSAYDALFASLVELEPSNSVIHTGERHSVAHLYVDLRLLVSQPSLLAQVRPASTPACSGTVL